MWKKPEELKATETIIGPSVHLEGNFTGQGDIQVAGSLTGSLQTAGNVRIEEGARVHANINAKTVAVAGEVRGDIKAEERVELFESARVWGNVETKILSVVPGAVLNGKCNMKSSGKFVDPLPLVKEPLKKEPLKDLVKKEAVLVKKEFSKGAK